MEADLLSDTLNIEEEGGGEANYSFAVNGVISISCVDGLLQLCGGEGMFPDESPVETGDACAAVNEGTGVDGFQDVRWFDKLDWDLHRRGGFYIDHSTLYTREDSHRRRFPV